MAETGGQEKTEEATSRRRGEARKEGNVARSTDLTAAFTLVAAVVMLYVVGQRLLQSMAHTMRVSLGGEFSDNVTHVDAMAGVAAANVKLMVWAVGPMVLVIAAVAMLGSLWQVGFMLSGKPLIPKFSKINPITGVKRFVDARAMMRLAQSLGKLILIAAVSWLLIYWEIEAILALRTCPSGRAAAGV